MTHKYTVGETVGYGHITAGYLHSGGTSTITKINGYGHIHLDNGLVFDRNFQERSKQFGRTLLALSRYEDIIRNCEERRRRQQAVVDLINRVKDKQLGAGGYGEFTVEDKDEMIRLIKRL